ncbi:hypothetical protein Glove_46g55 [Diversispora epigaea]|uniref:C2H2-type domain-containing protein n=1 Tax=Diversispora epigaea TaxID=1348612 RepID=A0A397JEL6_9GLOM|nr:hypothetical protein Glove_46g55 [Diversispora epigaea]
MPSRTSYDKPFPCYLCNCSYLSKSSLSSHEKKKHNENRIVPHYQYFSYIPEDIKFPEGLFYFLFSNESGFSYRPSIRKYYCIFKGESGYKRIGTIFRCEV